VITPQLHICEHTHHEILRGAWADLTCIPEGFASGKGKGWEAWGSPPRSHPQSFPCDMFIHKKCQAFSRIAYPTISETLLLQSNTFVPE